MKKEINSRKKVIEQLNYSRKKGEGRPTKKERRSLDKYLT